MCVSVTDIEWAAIKNNDKTYDGIFWYAVKSTKIFCRPSCPSKMPNRQNITVYYDKNEPGQRGYRQCKRCQPLGEPVDNEEWIKTINNILETKYAQKLSLEDLGHLAHGSPSYLRHVYKNFTGITPQQRLIELRLQAAKKELLQSNLAIKVIAGKVGIENVSYFIKKFREKYGESPLQYRKRHAKKNDS